MGKEELIACFQNTLEKSQNGNMMQKTARAIKSKCAKVNHITTLLPEQEINMNSQVVEQQCQKRSRYVWGDKQVNRIKRVSLSWGDLPIYHINVENDIVSIYRRINGSRDGWMTFPDGYFEEKKKPLNEGEKKKLFQFFETIDFTKWNTNETTILNIENMADGFLVSESFQCDFDDGTTFYCANPPQDQFTLMVGYFKKFFAEENMEPFYPTDDNSYKKASLTRIKEE